MEGGGTTWMCARRSEGGDAFRHILAWIVTSGGDTVVFFLRGHDVLRLTGHFYIGDQSAATSPAVLVSFKG